LQGFRETILACEMLTVLIMSIFMLLGKSSMEISAKLVFFTHICALTTQSCLFTTNIKPMDALCFGHLN
jgi:hypothetical protein